MVPVISLRHVPLYLCNSLAKKWRNRQFSVYIGQKRQLTGQNLHNIIWLVFLSGSVWSNVMTESEEDPADAFYNPKENSLLGQHRTSLKGETNELIKQTLTKSIKSVQIYGFSLLLPYNNWAYWQDPRGIEVLNFSFFLFIIDYKYQNNLFLYKTSYIKALRETESDFRFVYFFYIFYTPGQYWFICYRHFDFGNLSHAQTNCTHFGSVPWQLHDSFSWITAAKIML